MHGNSTSAHTRFAGRFDAMARLMACLVSGLLTPGSRPDQHPEFSIQTHTGHLAFSDGAESRRRHALPGGNGVIACHGFKRAAVDGHTPLLAGNVQAV